MDGKKIEVVRVFKYLGSTEDQCASLDVELAIRKQRMLIAFNKLAARIFQNHALSLSIKLRLFKIIVIENGAYGCGAWNMSIENVEQLEKYAFRLLRKIFGFRNLDFVANEVLMERAKDAKVEILPFEITLRKRQLLYMGRIERQRDDSDVKFVLHSEINGAKRPRGGRQSNFRKAVSDGLTRFNISRSDWMTVCREDERGWEKRVEEGGVFCLSEWLRKRAVIKAKRDSSVDLEAQAVHRQTLKSIAAEKSRF